jgi:alanine dehydrogenase
MMYGIMALLRLRRNTGAAARTSTIALGNATIPFMLALAGQGLACINDAHLLNGLNVHAGQPFSAQWAGAGD